MITQSRRTEFTGAHLDPRTKALIRYLLRVQTRAMAKQPGTAQDPSVSQFVSTAVEEKLARDLTPERVPSAPLRLHLRNIGGHAA